MPVALCPSFHDAFLIFDGRVALVVRAVPPVEGDSQSFARSSERTIVRMCRLDLDVSTTLKRDGFAST